MKGISQPVQVLYRQGLIQPQLGPHGRPILLGGELDADAEQGVVHRIAGGDAAQQEGRQGDAQEHWNKHEQPAADVL